MARISTTVTKPAAETAAAVKAPETLEATEIAARTSVTTSISTAPRGVRTALIIPSIVTPYEQMTPIVLSQKLYIIYG